MLKLAITARAEVVFPGPGNSQNQLSFTAIHSLTEGGPIFTREGPKIPVR